MAIDLSSAYSAIAVTLDATIPACRGIYVGGAGDVSVNMTSIGSAVIFKAAAAGSILPIQAAKVNTTGTTATNLLVLY